MSTTREFSTSPAVLYTGLRTTSNNNTNTTTATITDLEHSTAAAFGLVLQSAIVVVFLGNSLVLITLGCFRHWTSVDVLLSSLALADLLDSIVALQVITVVKYYLQRPVAKPLCDAFVGLVYTFRMASSTTVTFIAVERALLVTQPFRHHTLVSPTLTKKLLLGIWLSSIFFSILPFIGVGRSGFRKGTCLYQLYDLGKAYAILVEVYGAIMLSVVLFSYFAIKLSSKMFIRRQTLMTGHLNDKGGKRDKTFRNCGAVAQLPENTCGIRSVRKLTAMMGVVVIIYYISWLPFLLNNLFCLIVDQEPGTSMVLFTSLVSMLHSLANPPLYGWMSQRYRRGYFFVFKMALSMCGGHQPSRRSLSISRRLCTVPNLSRQATCTDITLTNSRLSLPQGNLAFTAIKEDKELEFHVEEDLQNNNRINENINIKVAAHDKHSETAERAHMMADADTHSVVSEQVIELLDAILGSFEK